MKKLILTDQLKKFDHPETLVVVSLYPKKGEVYSSNISGIASYSKNVVDSLNRRTIVLADFYNNKDFYLEKNALVVRLFKKNTKRMWLNILNALRQLKQTKKLLIQFDFLMYGNLINSALILPFLFLAKALGYEINFVSHSVVTDVGRLSGHVGLGKGIRAVAKRLIYNSIFKTFYWIVGLIVTNILVLEDKLLKKIEPFVKKDKLHSAPHAVDSSLNRTNKKVARKKLGIKQSDQVVMFFGFVNWFKGTDIFARTFSKTKKILGKNTKFIIAGGKSATLSSAEHYQKFFSETLDLVYNSDNVSITGFVPQSKIKDYFAAADLVVFPYRDFMCASGVLSLAFSYQKPFIVSKPLTEMLSTEDFAESLDQVGLRAKDLTFDLTSQSLKRKTTQVLRNGLKTKIVKLSKIMRQKRSFSSKANDYDKLIFSENGLMTPTSIVGKLRSAFSNVTS